MKNATSDRCPRYRDVRRSCAAGVGYDRAITRHPEREGSNEEPVSNPNVAVIIEDDADIRMLIAAVLSQTGLEVHSATAGLEGIELVRRVDPIVVTLDVSMPGIDGFETARRIREFSDSRILMVTARADDEHARRGREAGADDYITKPFRPRELRERVQAAIA